MLTVLSPAKSLDLERTRPTPRATRPRFLDDAATLVAVLRGYSQRRLAKLMKLSDDLARLNVERYAAWTTPFTARNARKAILTFAGDVYQGLAIDDYDRDDFAFAQGRLRILSGLYGLLRPLDLMQPYRLEMGTRLPVNGARDLYAFWGTRIADAIAGDLRKHEHRVLVNLASNEYAKAVPPAAFPCPIITPVFKEKKGRDLVVVGLLAKKARGRMADFIVRERIDDPAELRGFRRDGYEFRASLSDADRWVFVRG
ncbi:MAG: peroxide stress protein YaaA [Phycisphaerales bacterium]|nr:peroxide stress protein YaaA [Phycisphaerales bacterium]